MNERTIKVVLAVILVAMVVTDTVWQRWWDLVTNVGIFVGAFLFARWLSKPRVRVDG